MSDKTQVYIIRQNALTNANVFWERDDTKTEEKVLATAEKYANWVLGGEVKNSLPPLPKVDESKKEWLNFNTPDYNKAIELKKKGYSIKDLRNQYKIGGAVANELEKI